MPGERESGTSGGGIFGRLQTEIDRRAKEEGISPADLLELPDDLRALLQAFVREGELTAGAAAESVGMSTSEAEQLLPELEEKGYLTSREAAGERRYKTRFARRRGRDIPLDIWDALSDKIEESS